MNRLLSRALCGVLFCAFPLFAGEIYYTGFENPPFVVGDDTIAGTDGWTGSSAHAGLQLSAVASEDKHLLSGFGNAAIIGGEDTVLPAGTSRTVNVRRAFNLDPVILGEEVATFRVNLGIKDSLSTGFNTRRDNFEFAFYNSALQLIAFIQFDNTTLDFQTQAPAQKIWRSSYNSTLSRLEKLDTTTTFFYDVPMDLKVRINFRTNRWTVTLDGLDIISDLPFYTGPLSRSLGTIAAQMQIAGTGQVPGTFQTGPAPGENYMIFDNFALRLDPLPAKPEIYSLTRSAAGTMQFTWSTEAAYKYQVEYSDDLLSASQSWKTDLPNSLITAPFTGESAPFSNTPPAGNTRRIYRVRRILP